MNRCHQVFVQAIQIHVKNEMAQVIMIVPLRPKNLLRGSVNQHPMTPQQRYGAPLMRPSSQRFRSDSFGLIPNCVG